MSEANYSRGEEAALADALRRGEAPVCPRCGAPLARREVGPPPAVPYVRARVWFTCAGCGRGLVLDRRRLEPGSGP